MGWVNAPNTYQIALQFEEYFINYQNSVYFQYNEGDVSRAHARTVRDAVADWYMDTMPPLLADDHKLFGVAAIDLTTELSFTEFTLYNPKVAGTAGLGMPFNLCYQIWFQTATPLQAGLGCNNVSGIPREQVVGPYVNEIFAISLKEAYENLISIAPTVGCTWVVCSRHVNGADRAVALNSPITSVTYKGLDLSTWRQRQFGRHT